MGQGGLPCTPPMILRLGCHFLHWYPLRWKKDVNKKETHLDYVFFSLIWTHVKMQLFQQSYYVLGVDEIWAHIIACILKTISAIIFKLTQNVHFVILYKHAKLYVHSIFSFVVMTSSYLHILKCAVLNDKIASKFENFRNTCKKFFVWVKFEANGLSKENQIEVWTILSWSN